MLSSYEEYTHYSASGWLATDILNIHCTDMRHKTYDKPRYKSVFASYNTVQIKENSLTRSTTLNRVQAIGYHLTLSELGKSSVKAVSDRLLALCLAGRPKMVVSLLSMR